MIPAFDLALSELKKVNDPFYTGFVDLSVIYARLYKENGSAFIRCFLNYKSIREVCFQIVKTYKKAGIEVEGDFSEYARKQNIEEKWQDVLDYTLRIIYTISKPETV